MAGHSYLSAPPALVAGRDTYKFKRKGYGEPGFSMPLCSLTSLFDVLACAEAFVLAPNKLMLSAVVARMSVYAKSKRSNERVASG